MSSKKKPKLADVYGRLIGVRLGPEREAKLDEYIAAQPAPPKRSAVILAAVDRFLAQEAAARRAGGR